MRMTCGALLLLLLPPPPFPLPGLGRLPGLPFSPELRLFSIIAGCSLRLLMPGVSSVSTTLDTFGVPDERCPCWSTTRLAVVRRSDEAPGVV